MAWWLIMHAARKRSDLALRLVAGGSLKDKPPRSVDQAPLSWIPVLAFVSGALSLAIIFVVFIL